MRSTARISANLVKDPIARDLMIVSCLVTLVFTTSLTVDAFTPMKFACLVVGLFYLYTRYRKFFLSELFASRRSAQLVTAFLGHSLFLLLLNSNSISERLFGIQGRFFGLISVFSLLLLGIAIYLAVKSQKLRLDFLFTFILSANLIVAMVFFTQKFGIAFLEFQNDYTVLPSTLGNPNFLAAFLAFSILSGLYFLVASKRNFDFKFFFAIASIFASLYIIAISNSLQGPLGVGLGLIFLVLLTLLGAKPRLSLLLTVSILIVGIPLSQGFFGYGPLGNRLEQGTLVLRSMYWGIAGRIGMDRPLTGYGFDTYLDNYRKFRSSDEFRIYGAGLVSDSPHNLYLDFLVAGGIPYLFWAIAGSAYVFIVSFKTLRLLGSRNHKYTSFVFLVAMWCVLTVLALINPFQLAVTIWNVVTGSAIVGFYHQLIGENQSVLPIKKLNAQRNLFVRLPVTLSMIVFVNPFVAALPMVTEIRFRAAVESSDYKALRAVSMDWPFSGSRVAAISQGIVESSLKVTSKADLALERQLQDMIRSANDDALAATRINKESFDLWRFIFYNHPDSLVKEKARSNLIRLDPRELSWQTGKP